MEPKAVDRVRYPVTLKEPPTEGITVPSAHTYTYTNPLPKRPRAQSEKHSSTGDIYEYSISTGAEPYESTRAPSHSCTDDWQDERTELACRVYHWKTNTANRYNDASKFSFMAPSNLENDFKLGSAGGCQSKTLPSSQENTDSTIAVDAQHKLIADPEEHLPAWSPILPEPNSKSMSMSSKRHSFCGSPKEYMSLEAMRSVMKRMGGLGQVLKRPYMVNGPG
ncbi:hypothetical protein CONPUDRAFT_155730 [Coniophora puteana RWD-64-598 SS2]|uniref:Uncharacterized protein n=1 Tax=Coniophora puteana (strain RWD-64-598) TaxID=741705 RepID=A0A5M3MJD3_CONPW|nr:uncharacterized protein CONPUDRAFT_155730 [Coniophora puteana RWD-64-598 SS2]EIW79040.1 hypothetical protein CONPUDRAFT_155730 [Coniophora puteana RWD-64-598 SS2]